MKYLKIILGLIVIGFVMVSCTPSAPSTLEIMDTLKTKVNERDLEGVLTLYAEDAVFDVNYRNVHFIGIEEIEYYWTHYYFLFPYITEFRDISVEGDSATFIWAEIGTSYTTLWPTIIEVQNGKITYMDWPEDAEPILTGDE
jgi:hypothetical protein